MHLTKLQGRFRKYKRRRRAVTFDWVRKNERPVQEISSAHSHGADPLREFLSTVRDGKEEGVCDLCSERAAILLRYEDELWRDLMLISRHEPVETMTCPLCRISRNFESLKGALTEGLPEKLDLGYEIPDAARSFHREDALLPMYGFSDGSQTEVLLQQHTWVSQWAKPSILISRESYERTKARLEPMFPQEAALSLAKGWITACELQHEGLCLPSYQSTLRDLRVIDCENRKIVAAPPQCKFVALSYVWGNTTTQYDFDNGLEEWQNLPLLVQQSVQVTYNLGYRYLWIDRYCIRQKDPDDLKTQIMQMGDIYSEAHLTIVAAAGDSPLYGLPGVSPRFRTPLEKPKSLGTVHVYTVPRVCGLEDVYRDSAWVSRAWTFQEGYFARRRLVFTDRQMIFVCNTSIHYEAATIVKQLHPDEQWLSGHSPRHVEEGSGYEEQQVDNTALAQALRHLEQFSERSLRFDSDALNAISGALNTLLKERVYHIWGVPFRYGQTPLPDGGTQGEIALTWRHVKRRPSRRRAGFPSWSPLGWENPVRFVYPVDICSVLVRTAAGTETLQTLLPDSGILPADCSQQLQIETQAAEFDVVKIDLPEGPYKAALHYRAALHYINDTYALLNTVWDVDPSTMKTVKGIFLLPEEQKSLDFRRGSGYVLLLRACGNYYERIGFAWLVVPDAPHDSTTYDEYKFRDQGKTYHMLDSPRLPDRAWWMDGSFTKETILLG